MPPPYLVTPWGYRDGGLPGHPYTWWRPMNAWTRVRATPRRCRGRAEGHEGLVRQLCDEDGETVSCGPQKGDDLAEGVGGCDRLRDDQPEDERGKQEPDESSHRPPPFRAGRGER